MVVVGEEQTVAVFVCSTSVSMYVRYVTYERKESFQR